MSQQTKQEKEPFWLNQRDMAASLGVTIQTLARWGVQPVAKIGKENFYTVRNVLDNRLANSEQKTNPEPIDAIPGTIEYERLRLTREQADQLELKNELARAKVVPIELFTAVLTQVAAETAGLLDTLPLQIKRKHPALETAVIDAIKWQCVKAQNAMARVDSVVDQVIEDHVASLESD